MLMGLFAAFVLIWLPCSIYTAVTAADKGHNATNWFFGGLLIGPIALVSAVGLGDRKLRRYQRFMAEAQGYKEGASAADQATKIIDEKRTGGGSYPWMK